MDDRTASEATPRPTLVDRIIDLENDRKANGEELKALRERLTRLELAIYDRTRETRTELRAERTVHR